MKEPTTNFIEDLKYQWMAMIDAIDDPLAIVNRDGVILRANRPYLNLGSGCNGLSIKDISHKKCYEIFAGRSEPCSGCLIVGQSYMEPIFSWNGNEIVFDREFHVKAYPLSDFEGEERFVVHYRDVTEINSLHEQLSRADKLAALGKLSGGVAHEINSPLAGILAFAQMAIREMDESNPHKKDMFEIEKAARKCKVIIENLLNFSRQEKISDTSDVMVRDALASTLSLVAPLLRKHKINSVDDFSACGIVVRANMGKLEQVFLNMVTNAVHAMKDNGGILRISLYEDKLDVVIEFEDSGTGIREEHLSKIFDPFYTTKPIGEGTGLGLSISYSIVKQYGGDISVASVLGEGTVFKVRLPIVR